MNVFNNSWLEIPINYNPKNIYLFKPINGNTRKRCGICSKLTTKTTERRFDIFIVSFEDISHFFIVFLLLSLNR